MKLSGPRWERARRGCFERDGYRCQQCRHAGRLEAHHIRKLEDGGSAYVLGNLRTLCRACHIELHKPTLSPARQAWADLVNELQRG